MIKEKYSVLSGRVSVSFLRIHTLIPNDNEIEDTKQQAVMMQLV